VTKHSTNIARIRINFFLGGGGGGYFDSLKKCFVLACFALCSDIRERNSDVKTRTCCAVIHISRNHVGTVRLNVRPNCSLLALMMLGLSVSCGQTARFVTTDALVCKIRDNYARYTEC